MIVGLCFVAVGLIAMSQRRRRRIGLLMVAVGLTWFIYDVGWVYMPLTYTIGTLGAGLYQPILAHHRCLSQRPYTIPGRSNRRCRGVRPLWSGKPWYPDPVGSTR